MYTKQIIVISAVALGTFGAGKFPQETGTKVESIRGWLSDEQCARGRAEGGTYTATNAQCAKECVAKGKKIVLIDPDKKRILLIGNQAEAKKHIGDYVEISGKVDEKSQTLEVSSLKFLDSNHAMCGVPPKKSQTKQP